MASDVAEVVREHGRATVVIGATALVPGAPLRVVDPYHLIAFELNAVLRLERGEE